jgi:hypothetical protein
VGLPPDPGGVEECLGRPSVGSSIISIVRCKGDPVTRDPIFHFKFMRFALMTRVVLTSAVQDEDRGRSARAPSLGFVPGTSEYGRYNFASIAARSPAGAAASFARSLLRFSLRCRRRWISVGCRLPLMIDDPPGGHAPAAAVARSSRCGRSHAMATGTSRRAPPRASRLRRKR